jgi:drug/metabolite transporter (DMT)-like permease
MAAGRSGPVEAGTVTAGVLILVAAVTLLWGLNWPIMKVGLTEISPWSFRAVSIYGSGITLLLLALLTGERVRLAWRHLLPLAVVAFFSITSWHMLTAYGLRMIGGGRAAIIAYTMPIWAAVLSAGLLGERLQRRHLVGLGLGMLGMVLLLGPDIVAIGHAPLGSILVLVAAFCWAAGTVGIKMWEWGIGTKALTAWQLLIGGIPVLLVRPFVEPWPDFGSVSVPGLLSLGYTTFVALVFCFTAFIWLVRRLPATVAAITTLAIPVVGVASSAWMLGEPVGVREVLSLLFVLGALSLVLLPRRERA